MKKMHLIIAAFSVYFLSACSSSFEAARLQIQNVELKSAYVDPSQAYYLSEDGVLYSPGADSDASCYVSYSDEKRGIVAENVRSFGVMACGGYYVTEQNELFLYNQNALNHCNYSRKETHQGILENVSEAMVTTTKLVWVDQERNLYFVGTMGEESFSIDKPCFLGKDVAAFSLGTGFVMWADEDGIFHCYGDFSEDLFLFNEVTEGKQVSKIFVDEDYTLILCEGDLFLQGESAFYKRTKEESGEVILKLASSVVDFDCSHRTLGAKTENGDFQLWGRIIASNAEETETPAYEFVNQKTIAQNVKSVFVWDSNAGYIDRRGKSQIFHSDLGWSSFYGNSDDAPFVGIYGTPRTWKNSD